MEHRPAEAQRWQPAPDEHFTGRVWLGPLAEPAEPADLHVPTALHLFVPLRRTFSTPARPSLRAPCIYGHLDRFADTRLGAP